MCMQSMMYAMQLDLRLNVKRWHGTQLFPSETVSLLLSFIILRAKLPFLSA